MSDDTTDTRLHAVLDAMPHKVWMASRDGAALYYNRAMREFAGAVLSLSERSGRERILIHPEDAPAFAAARCAARRHGNSWTAEVRLRSPDGGWRWHRLDFAALSRAWRPLRAVAPMVAPSPGADSASPPEPW